MLGIDARAAVPQPSSQVARLEILPPADSDSFEGINNIDQFTFHLKWPGQLPPKCKSFALKKKKRILQFRK